MPGGNTRTALHFDPFPLYGCQSRGATLTDVDDHDDLDVLGELTADLFGHSDPCIMRTVAEVARHGVSNGAPGEAEMRLAEAMCARFPQLGQVRFCNSDTEANLYALALALALARHATGRAGLMAFSGAYHGGVLTFGAVGAMNAPYEWTLGRYNDAAGAAAAIRRGGDRPATVIVEPMMSNGGCIPA